VSEAKSNLSRLQSDQFATPVASQDIKKMVKPPAKRAYGKPGQLDVFKGDGPDDPKRSHNYGL
jgi:hypothetical protein